MTEWDKMRAGKLYVAGDQALRQMRMTAKKLCIAYNALPPDADETQRRDILQKLIGHMEDTPHFEPIFRCDYGRNITIGRHFFSNYNLVILDSAPVFNGDDVLIGPNVGLFTATHPLDPEQRASGLELAKPITIQDGVWIGGGSIINPGVTVGKGSIIGAGSVVTKDIPPGVIAVGSPCRVLRPLTEADKMPL